MNKHALVGLAFLIVSSFLGGCSSSSSSSGGYNIRSFGAKGDGKTLDTAAINSAIDAAAGAGGGTVYFPPGQYLSVSIHLKSNICLYLDQGSTLVAADPKEGFKYDPPEPSQWDKYEDFGHCHWHNSLIWGENLVNVSIMGPGEIYGQGLNDGRHLARRGATTTSQPVYRESDRPENNTSPEHPFGYPTTRDSMPAGWGNKSIALKLCRNVILRDFTIRHGGHFGNLATGVDNFTIDNLKIDTDRDGMDIDCCQNVRVSNCFVNSPFDDGICLKSCYALGYNRPCQNVTITNCQVSGYDEGTLLDGTYGRSERSFRGGPTGRIKFGTESNGGFKNIAISNCVFEYCRGLALETVDGALCEDVAITNITMRDIVNAPIFLRLGARLRGPADDTKIGTLQRVTISNIVCYNADPKYGSIISGIPDHTINDVKLSDIRIYYKGGGKKEWASTQPAEKAKTYPEPGMFGEMPSYGFYFRHVKGIELRDVEVSYIDDDPRPPFVLDDVEDVQFNHVKAQHLPDVPTYSLKNVRAFSTFHCPELQDLKRDKVDEEKF